MSLFRRLFYRVPPDGLVEISDHVFVFNHCFSMDFFEEDELSPYIGGIIEQLCGRYSIDSFMIFNFEGGKKDNQIARIFSDHNTIVMGYPRNYEGCPLLTIEMIHHFLRSSESWLSLGQDNLLLMHSEQGGWPVLAFALAALLVYLRRYTDEGKALQMVYRQAPSELVELFSPLDPVPSQLRYLKYVSRRHVSPELWPPGDKVLNLNCAIIRKIPNFDGQGGCRPIFRIYGPDPLVPNDKSTKVLFSIPKKSDFVQHYSQEDCEIIKVNVRCPVQGDVVLECISLDEDFEHEVMLFRVMFNASFVEDNLLLLDRDQIDILWDTKDRFPVDFRVEIIFSEMDATTSMHTSEISREEKESLSRVKDVFSHLDWSIKRDSITTDTSEQKGSHSAYGDFDAISLVEPETSGITPEHRHSLPTVSNVEPASGTYLLHKSDNYGTTHEINHDSLAPKLQDSGPDADETGPAGLVHPSQNFHTEEAVNDAYLLQKSEVAKVENATLELRNNILALKLQENRSVQVNESKPEHSHASMLKFDDDQDAVAGVYSLSKSEILAPNFEDHKLFKDASAEEDNTMDGLGSGMMNFRGSEAGEGAIAEWSDTNTDMFMSGSPSSSIASSPPKFDEDIMAAGMLETQS